MLFGKMKRDEGPLLLMRKGASPPPLPPKSNQTRKVMSRGAAEEWFAGGCASARRKGESREMPSSSKPGVSIISRGRREKESKVE